MTGIMTPNLVELVSRIEAASGPDRELDLDIARLLGVTVMRRNDEDTANVEYTHWHFTASLDAAMSLVPEGMHLSLVGPAGRTHSARLDGEGVSGEVGLARSFALALCSAALRSRSLTDEER